jgi:SAM-dependent methyltransferase
MIVLLLALLIIHISDRQLQRRQFATEGFEQSQPFLMKRDDQIYDGFYAEIYDELNNTADRTGFEYHKIVELTRPSLQHSTFLDIGSGTGHLVNILTKAGYNAHGLDSSKDMVAYSHEHFPNTEIKCGDALQPIQYMNSTFTHITCMNGTVYHFQDKRTLFRNCRRWLKPNGFLIIHFMDKDNDKSQDTELRNVEYKTSRTFHPDNTVSFVETFTDKATHNVRQNEQTLYMENKEEIVRMIMEQGFIAHAQINMDNGEYMYVFERLM